METNESGAGTGLRYPRVALAIEAIIILTAAVLALLGLRTVFAGDALNSRLATVYSLTHDGTWCIERPLDRPPNPFEQRTIDKVEVHGRLLSSKPPVLPLLMSGEYLLMHWAVGWDLDQPTHLKPIAQAMIGTFVALPYVLGLIAFAGILGFLTEKSSRRIFVLAALAFATQFSSYAPQMNNHVPAAGMMLIALYLAIGLGTGRLKPRAWRFALFGCAASLVFAIEIPLTIYVALPGLWLLWRFPRQALLWGGLGALPVLTVHFGIMTVLTGSPLPVQISKDPFLFESSYWRQPMGIDALNEPKLTYLFHMTVGRHGTFLLYPILLIGLAGLWHAARYRDTRWRAPVLAGALAFAILTMYYLTGTNNYGGAAYGFRWHIGSMPVLLLMGVPFLQNLRRGWLWVLLAALLAVSAYSAWECYQTPWGVDQEWTSRLLFGPSV